MTNEKSVHGLQPSNARLFFQLLGMSGAIVMLIYALSMKHGAISSTLAVLAFAVSGVAISISAYFLWQFRRITHAN